MNLHKIMTSIQDKIGGDYPCRVIVEIDTDGSLRFTAAWNDQGGGYVQTATMFTKTQLELTKDQSCFVDLFVVLVKESEEYKNRQEGAG